MNPRIAQVANGEQIAASLPLPQLRLPTNVEFASVPPSLQEQICRTLGVPAWRQDLFQIRATHEDADNRKHYHARVQAIANGVKFLLDSNFFPAFKFPDQLNSYIAAITADCIKHIDSLKTNDIQLLQTILADYVGIITKTLATEFKQTEGEIKEYLSSAEELVLALETKPALCTVTKLPGAEAEFIATIDRPLDPFTNTDLIQELKSIKKNDGTTLPRWFSELSTYQQHIIKFFLTKIDLDHDLGTRINSISSKFRFMPIPSNYGIHTLITHLVEYGNSRAKTTVYTPEIRSAHTASRDVDDLPIRIKQLHATRNIETEIEEAIKRKQIEITQNAALQQSGVTRLVIPVLYQTLITPVLNPDSSLEHQRTIAMQELCYKMQQKKYTAGNIELVFDFVVTNHALNYGKYFCFTTPGSQSGKEATRLFGVIADHLYAPTKPEKIRLLEAVKEKLNSLLPDYTTLFSSYRELYLTSLEQLSSDAYDGISIGSCVSGKDRKAIEIIHTNAMKVFFAIHGKLPPMSITCAEDEEATRLFQLIFRDLFGYLQQQTAAETNAPGSCGIKTPWIYLPQHLINAINEWYAERDVANSPYENCKNRDMLVESDRLATNNELTKINSGKVSSELKSLLWNPVLPATGFVVQLNPTDVINQTIAAIGSDNLSGYLSTRHHHLKFLARQFDSERGRIRAHAFKELLSGNLTDLNKMIFVAALLANPQGVNLQDHVAKAIGFLSVETAKEAIIATIQQSQPIETAELNALLVDIYTKLNSLTQHEHMIPAFADITAIMAPFESRALKAAL